MTILHAAAPPAQAGRLALAAGAGRFRGDAGAYWRLLARGAVLLMVTLGIYRFWLTTDIRRFLWSNTELAGQSLEYTGTAREILLGFLVADCCAGRPEICAPLAEAVSRAACCEGAQA